jgi:outer membrane immunogenic protein
MKRILATIAMVAFSSAAASAADMPAKVYTKAPVLAPIYNWTGFYVGGHVGYGWGSESWTRIAGSGGEAGIGTVRSFDLDGALAGGQIGFNYQVSQWVFGVEGEMSWSGVGGGLAGFNNNGPASWNTDVNWIGTLTGRIGYAFDRSLLYVKGGGAWADNDYNHPATGGQLQALLYTGSATRSGWLIGAGFEYGFAPNWSAKIEYNYIDFGTERITLNGTGGRWVTFDSDQEIQTVKLGINYRFGGGPVVAKY